MKRDKLITISIWIFLIIIISNLPPTKTFFSLFFDDNHYRYSNNNGSFTFTEFKGHDTDMMYRRYNSFKIERQYKPDTILYRTFWKNPLAFWRWGEYAHDKRYKLPYKNWKGIRERRGYDLKYSNNLQDF